MHGFLTRVSLSLPAAALAGASVAARFAGTVPLPLAVDRLDTWERFNAISQPAADLVANGRLAKWFADLDDAAGPRLEFINTNFTRNGETPDAARYHWSFARETFAIPEDLPEFNQVTFHPRSQAVCRGNGSASRPPDMPARSATSPR